MMGECCPPESSLCTQLRMRARSPRLYKPRCMERRGRKGVCCQSLPTRPASYCTLQKQEGVCSSPTDTRGQLRHANAPGRQAPPLLLPTCRQGRLPLAAMLGEARPDHWLEAQEPRSPLHRAVLSGGKEDRCRRPPPHWTRRHPVADTGCNRAWLFAALPSLQASVSWAQRGAEQGERRNTRTATSTGCCAAT